MENKENGRIVTFKNLWDLLVQRFLVIALVAIVGSILFLAVSRMTYTPVYQSTVILYIQRQSDTTSVGDASSEFSLSLKLVNDCIYFVKSHTVLDQVIADLDLDMSYRQLYNSISAHNPDNTRFLEITVKAGTPEQAKEIADRIGQIAPQVIDNAMGRRQVYLFEEGTLNESPSNKTGMIIYAVVFVMLAAATYVVYLIQYLLNDQIRTDEDVERILGLTILGSIPDANATFRNESKYYGYGRTKKKKGTGAK